MPNTKIIHLSDLHIGKGQDAALALERIVAAIDANYRQAVIVVTGDLTNSATLPQMQAARAQLLKLALNNIVLPVPGNHDYNWSGLVLRQSSVPNWNATLGTPFGPGVAARAWMGPSEEPQGIHGIGVYRQGAVTFFGVDSGDPRGKESTARGYISKGLADGLQAALVAERGQARVVFLHHHPFTRGPFMGLEGSARFMSAVQGNCELLLFGHKHKLGLWWNSNGVKLTCASHRTTEPVFEGEHLMINVVEIAGAGTANVRLWHRLELL